MLNEYTIVIPKTIENTMEGFRFLTDLLNEIEKVKDSTVVLDFSKTRWLEADLTAVLAAVFKQTFKGNNKIRLYKMSNSIFKVLCKNGFLQEFGLNSEQNDIYETTIKFSIFNKEDRVKFQEYLKSEFIPKINLSMTEGFSKELRRNLDEVFQNSRMHGKCDEIYVCGQYYYYHKKVKFTIVDLGVTILDNVKGKLGRGITAENAIDWATRDGNSTKIGESGGLGLYQLRKFLKENGGKIQIVSSNGYWNEYDNEIIMNVYDKQFKGTIVNIEVDINDKIYLSMEEKDKINKYICNVF